MTNLITVTINPSNQDHLSTLLTTLQAFAPHMSPSATQAPATPVSAPEPVAPAAQVAAPKPAAPKAAAPKVETPAPKLEAPKPPAAEAAAVPGVSLSQVRARLATFLTPADGCEDPDAEKKALKARAKTALDKFKAISVSEMKAEDYAAFLEELSRA